MNKTQKLESIKAKQFSKIKLSNIIGGKKKGQTWLCGPDPKGSMADD